MSQRIRTDPSDVSKTFGARLRETREQRHISIASIAENTKILGALLEGLENDDVSRWPTGFYRRAFIRAYATSIGLDPESVVREFSERFPDPETLSLPAAATLPVSPGESVRDRRSASLRVAVPEGGTWFSAGPLIRHARLRCFAVAVDGFVLSVLGVGLFAVLGSFWAPLAIATAIYYAGSIMILGNTPGVCLFAARQPPGAGDDDGGRPAPAIVTLLQKITRRNHWREARASS